MSAVKFQSLFAFFDPPSFRASDIFPTQNALKQGDALSPLLFPVALECMCTYADAIIAFIE
jgi:hypothetical protein